MTTLVEFQAAASEHNLQGTFQDLCDLTGGAEAVFSAYLADSLDTPLKDWILLNASEPFRAFMAAKGLELLRCSVMCVTVTLKAILETLTEINTKVLALSAVKPPNT